ncbi:hypothetical protein A3860_14895 [Niastella vici]|uniref:Uncharacterized protein n=1 Tax=Niastella vici TaxID=1703345 RepID=A0A1V9G5W1_9BACT|nr:hypothetical protein [Niastella vici]OQP65878.1 hypothetical protein A3860_14895 [Niastella vici]
MIIKIKKENFVEHFSINQTKENGIILPIAGLDIGAINSGNSVVQWFRAEIIKTEFQAYCSSCLLMMIIIVCQH